jgi:hypothetical protein
MRYRQTFTVEGSGQFPIDMLRYDCCWLTDEIWDPQTLLGYDLPKRQVRITRYVETKNTMPSARWPSRGGWQVLSDSIRTERLP